MLSDVRVKQALKITAIVFAVIAVIGLISFFGKVRHVNAGAFILPLAVSAVSFVLYKKN